MAIEITAPKPNQLIPPGTSMLVSGGGADGDPDRVRRPAIESVTAQLDGGTPTVLNFRTIVNPRDPYTTQITFQGNVDISGAADGPHQLTVTAVFSLDTFITPPVSFTIVQPPLCVQGVPYTNFGLNVERTPLQICSPGTLEDFAAAVQQAEAGNHQAHAFGGKWSFSGCVISPDQNSDTNTFLVKTTQLQGFVNTDHAVQKAVVASAGDPDLLAHFHGGTLLVDVVGGLDRFVSPSGQKRPLGLPTMPNSSGMTIAGAVSTGTHGGDQWLAPMADAVAAIHLVGAGGTQYWIEPSFPITDPTLVSQYVAPGIQQANIIYNDSIFESALVSVGAMGIIYSLVIRVRDQYFLEETVVLSDWQTFKASSSLPFDHNTRYLSVVVDPYPDANGVNPCLIQTRTEVTESTLTGGNIPSCTQGNVNGAVQGMLWDFVGAEPFPTSNAWTAFALAYHMQQEGFDTAQIAVAVFNYILSQGDTKLWGVATQDYPKIMTAWIPPGTCGGRSYEVMDQSLRGGGLSSSQDGGDSVEFTFEGPNDRTGELPFTNFVDAAISAINAATNTIFVGWVSLRFTAKTRAALGMQQPPRCCSVEITTARGIQGLADLLSSLIDLAYRKGGIPHWGQRNDGLVTRGNATMYPRLGEWRAAYARLSANLQQRTFENAFTTQWQLTTPSIDVVAVSPSSFSFGNVIVDQTAKANIVVINNSFMGLIFIWGLLQPGGIFTVEAPPTGGAIVPPGQSLTIWVAVTPAAEGLVQNQLVISTPDTDFLNDPQVPLSANGVPVDAAIPDVVGDLTAVAENAIRAAGGTTTVRHVVDAQCLNINRVITQSPAAGTAMQPGEVITITVGMTPPNGCP
jgi:hypothetical protein